MKALNGSAAGGHGVTAGTDVGVGVTHDSGVMIGLVRLFTTTKLRHVGLLLPR